MIKYKPIAISGFEKLYEISDTGIVKNAKTNKILAQRIRNGYKTVYLYSKEKSRTLAVHRLVALTFIKNENNYKIVNHIDGNKLNNNINNLEWSTQKENINHALKNGLITPSTRQVVKMDKESNVIEIYNSIELAAASINLTRHSIIRVCKGKNKTAGGYKWKYLYDDKKIDKNIESRGINGYNYRITSNGEVYSEKTKKILKSMKNKNGYCYVTLTRNGNKKNFYVHQLVASTFLDNEENKKYVNHINRNKSDNRIENLEWVTHSENVNHYYSSKNI